MLKWLSIVCCIILTNNTQAQDSLNVVSWEKAIAMNPDSVIAIDASHLKWETIPTELYKFKSLRYLDLSRNKLTTIPDEFGSLSNLRWLNIGRNKITEGIGVVMTLSNLRYLDIGKNEFESLPPTVSNLHDLEVLMIWSNPINELPEELIQCKKLRIVDMRAILTSASFQESWANRMPSVNWQFDAPCHCVD